MLSPTLLKLIKEFEGFSLKTYLDPIGIPTIGYGHALPHNTTIYNCTIEQAENWLQADVQIARIALMKLTVVPLSFNQQDALTDFIFNAGAGNFQRSTLRQKLNRKEYKLIPSELTKWIYAGTKKLPGLIRRRQAESLLFTSL